MFADVALAIIVIVIVVAAAAFFRNFVRVVVFCFRPFPGIGFTFDSVEPVCLVCHC